MMIHHSADSSTNPQFLKINGSHRARGFPKSLLGFYVGYHFVIDTDAVRYQSRQTGEWGAHAASSCDAGPCNTSTIGVCLAGNFLVQKPTEGQLVSLYQLWKDLGSPQILYHKDVKDTQCPGVFDFRRDLEARRLPDLQKDLKLSEWALQKKLSLSRKNMLERKIVRLKQLITSYSVL